MRWMVAMVLLGCGAATRVVPPEEAADPNGVESWANARLIHHTFEPFVPPEPPMQGAPWEAPDGLDPALAETVRAVYAAAYPDPRGCEYRMVEVWERSLWDEGHAVHLPMFVLPGEPAAAIDWEGIVHRVLSVGEPADLLAHAALVRDAIAAAPPDLRVATSTSVTLARLGMVVAVEAEPSAVDLLNGWYFRLAEHALLSFMRGDDDEAMYALDVLDRVDPLPAGTPVVATGNAYELRPAMRAELTRRVAGTTRLEIEGDRFHADLSDVPTDVLIAALDDVRARQMGQPGGIDFLGEPVPRALVARGEEVVEPLLDVLESDARLTRSVHFWRDFAPPRTMSAVYEVAYVVLANVLDWSLFDAACTGCDLTNAGVEARERVADQMRSFWATTGRLTPAQRMLAVLADDEAGPEAWAQAAVRLLAPGDEDAPEASSYVVAFPEVHEGAGRLVDSLTDAERAGLTSSLVARLTATMALTHDEHDHDDECNLAWALAEWDRDGGRDPLFALATRCLGGDLYCPCRAGLAEVAIGLEASAVERLAAFLRTDDVTPEDLVLADELRGEPRIAAVLAEVYAPGAPVWSDTELRDVFTYDAMGMLGVREVRDEAIRRLTECGGEPVEVEVRGDRLTIRAAGWSLSTTLPNDAGGVANGRVIAHDCDVFASQLTERIDRPAFPIWRTDAEREQARRELIETVRTWVPPRARTISLEEIDPED